MDDQYQPSEEFEAEGSPEQRLWAEVMRQSVEDLQRGLATLESRRDLVERLFLVNTPEHVDAAWEVLRDCGLYQSARQFIDDEAGYEAVLSALECDPKDGPLARAIDALPEPAVPPLLAAGLAVIYLDRASPGWRDKPGNLPGPRRETVRVLREQFPGL